MRLMKGSKEVATLVDTDNGFVLRRNKDIREVDLPIDLFFTGIMLDKMLDEVDYTRFINWLKDRVVPDTRDEIDLDRILSYHRMKKYDAFELAVKTQGVLTCLDDFWVDWEEPDRKQENPICW